MGGGLKPQGLEAGQCLKARGIIPVGKSGDIAGLGKTRFGMNMKKTRKTLTKVFFIIVCIVNFNSYFFSITKKKL